MLFSLELGLIVLFSIIGGVLAVRFKQPSVLGLILAGALIGPNALGLVKSTELIESSIEIGAILLMFTIGTEFSLKKMLNIGPRVLMVSVMKLGITFGASFYISILLGFDKIAALYIGAMLSITSTVILIKILEQKGLAKNKEEFTFLVAILILEDVFGVFALTFFSGLNTSADLQPLNLIFKILLSLAIMVISYLVLQRLLKPAIKWIVKYSTEDTFLFTSFALCGGMAALAYFLNLSPSVGAFLAGNIVSTMQGSKNFEKSIRPFTLMFTSLFFLAVGTNVNFSVVFDSWFIILILFIVWLALAVGAIIVGSYVFMNFEGKKAVMCGLAMIPIGEFSLLIAKESRSLNLGADLLSIITAIILLSALTMSLVVARYDSIYNRIKRLVPGKILSESKIVLNYLNSLSLLINKSKATLDSLRKERHSIFKHLATILGASLLYIYAVNYLPMFDDKNSFYLLTAVLFVIIAVPTFYVIVNIRGIITDFSKLFVGLFPNQANQDKKILRHFVINLCLFALVAVLPPLFSFYQHNLAFHMLYIALLIFTVFYTIKSVHAIHQLAAPNLKQIGLKSKIYRQQLLKEQIVLIKDKEE